MGAVIRRGEGRAIAVRGDWHPVGLAVGDVIAEPSISTDSGTSVSFENCYNDAAEVSVAGKSVQETLSGKNLLNNDASDWGGSIYSLLELQENTRYVISIKQKDGVEIPSDMYIGFSTGDWTSSGEIIGPWIVSNGKINFSVKLNNGSNTLSENTVFQRYVAVYHKKYVEKLYDFFDIQLELGTTATSYEPYCGGIPSPNHDYPQDIVSIDSAKVESRGSNGESSTCDLTSLLAGRSLRSLPDGTHDEVVVRRDGTVVLIQRCDPSMFDQTQQISNDWKLPTPTTTTLGTIDPPSTFHGYTQLYEANGADITASVRVID